MAHAAALDRYCRNSGKHVGARGWGLSGGFGRVAGAAVIFEVQRSSRSEARKEEVRRQELEAMKQRDEELNREIEFLKNRIDELERQTKTRGLSSIFSIGHAESTKDKVKAG
ncbi:putative GTP-binding protein TypA/BipA -like protein [Capsicum annuum]|nr:putative GTP-binding protein TypA/BipA -like protein [Capsicum annuum]